VVTIIQSTVKNAIRKHTIIISTSHYLYTYHIVLYHTLLCSAQQGSIFCMLRSLSNDASFEWYQWHHEQCCHSCQPLAKKEDCFYMIFVLDIFIYILYRVYRLAMTGIFGVPTACSSKRYQYITALQWCNDRTMCTTKVGPTVLS